MTIQAVTTIFRVMINICIADTLPENCVRGEDRLDLISGPLVKSSELCEFQGSSLLADMINKGYKLEGFPIYTCPIDAEASNLVSVPQAPYGKIDEGGNIGATSLPKSRPNEDEIPANGQSITWDSIKKEADK